MTRTSIVASALIATTLFASLQSCKKKSDTSPSTRITSFTDSSIMTSGTYVTTFNLTYSDNKLSVAKYINKGYTSSGISYDSATRMYNYVDGKCIITTSNQTNVDTIYLDGEKITKINSNAVTFYDGTNKVKSYRGAEYTWDGDNLAKTTGTSDTFTYTYNTSKDASNAHPMALMTFLQYGRLFYTNKNLISTRKEAWADGGYNVTYDYTFDGSGRLTNAVETKSAYGPGVGGPIIGYFSYNY